MLLVCQVYSSWYRLHKGATDCERSSQICSTGSWVIDHVDKKVRYKSNAATISSTEDMVNWCWMAVKHKHKTAKHDQLGKLRGRPWPEHSSAANVLQSCRAMAVLQENSALGGCGVNVVDVVDICVR
jgi:hypothetical protein